METIELQHELEQISQYAATVMVPIIRDASAYTEAGATLKAVKKKYHDLEEREKEITRPLNDSLRSVRDLFRNPKDLLLKIESNLKNAMLGYQRAEEAKRAESQRIAEDLARKERERLARLAEKAEARGAADQAEAFQQRAAAVVAPIVAAHPPKINGMNIRVDHDFEILDAALLPREFLMPDEQKIRKVVRALGLETSIPGVRIFERQILSSRRV